MLLLLFSTLLLPLVTGSALVAYDAVDVKNKKETIVIIIFITVLIDPACNS